MSDITIVYSGGSQNTGQEGSLGGFPSLVEIGDEINNIFDNITPQQTTLGKTDYKCFYIFNDSAYLKYEITLYSDFLSEDGSTIYVGLLFQNEKQKLKFIGNPNGGTFQISIQGFTTQAIIWDVDNAVTAYSIKVALDNLSGGDCTVSVVEPDTFLITFSGDLRFKSLSNLSVTNNQLTPLGTITETINKTQIGSPINTVAPDTGDTKTLPTSIPFSTIFYPGLIAGVLYPAEGFPIWIKRFVPENSTAIENDGFNLHLKTVGTTIE